jgi:hypothetical protein
MAKRRRKKPLTDAKQFDLSVQLENVREALLLARDVLYDHITLDSPKRLQSVPGVISLALEEVERVNAAWSEIAIPEKPAPKVAAPPPVAPTGPTLVVDNTRGSL